MQIKTIKEIAVERARECQAEVGERFKKSVGIVYGYNDKRQFIAYGSCVFIQVSGEKYLVTAAHVVDDAKQYGFSITGSGGLVQISDDFYATVKVDGSRLDDKHDFAFLKLASAIVADLGDAVEFIDDAQVSKNRGALQGRQYLVIGFPAAKNTRMIDRSNRRLRPQPWSYQGTSIGTIDDALAARSGLSDEVNLALKFDPEQVGDDSGNVVTPPDPHGVSGGALIDLGLPHPDRLPASTVCVGRLSGVMMEVHGKERLLAAVRIEHIVAAIKSNLPGPRVETR